MVSRTEIELVLIWDGRAGRHVVHLRQSLDESGADGERDEGVANAVMIFRNVVGMEVIEDALAGSEWSSIGPVACDGGEESSEEQFDEWHRLREI